MSARSSLLGPYSKPHSRFLAAVFTGLTLWAGNSFAVGDVTGTVTRIVIQPQVTTPSTTGGLVFIYLTETILVSPAVCSASGGGQSSFVIDLTKEGGKSAYNAVLIAQAMGRQVRALGRGTCTFSDSLHEDINYVDLR